MKTPAPSDVVVFKPLTSPIASDKDNGIVFGGGDPTAYRVLVEHWNGSSWTEIAEMANGRYANCQHSSLGAVSGKAAGGNNPPSYNSATEDFVATATLANVTVS